MSDDRFQLLRVLEAMLFASAEPTAVKALVRRLPEGADVAGLLAELQGLYANRGVNLVQHEDRWCFRTAPDLADRLQIETTVQRKLSRAAIETLSTIAYHQPVTRAEIEEIRGVSISQGTVERLLEIGWIKPKGRRETPGRPVTWGTTDSFLEHFGLESLDALPGIEELRAAGLLDARPAISTLGAQVMQAMAAQNGGDEDEEDAEESDLDSRGNAEDGEPRDPQPDREGDMEASSGAEEASDDAAAEDDQEGDEAAADDDAPRPAAAQGR
jgi:segregation and condensation protein B